MLPLIQLPNRARLLALDRQNEIAPPKLPFPSCTCTPNMGLSIAALLKKETNIVIRERFSSLRPLHLNRPVGIRVCHKERHQGEIRKGDKGYVGGIKPQHRSRYSRISIRLKSSRYLSFQRGIIRKLLCK